MAVVEKFVSSESVKVFPSAYRGEYQTGVVYNPESKLFSEFNISNIINRLSSRDSFVLESHEVEKEDTSSIETCLVTFNVHGYWFEVLVPLAYMVGTTKTYQKNIFAVIELAKKNTTADAHNIEYPALCLKNMDSSTPAQDNLDVSGSFCGLKIVYYDSEITLTDGQYKLKLFEQTEDETKFITPESSLLKFKSSEIENSFVTGEVHKNKSINDNFETNYLEVWDATSLNGYLGTESFEVVMEDEEWWFNCYSKAYFGEEVEFSSPITIGNTETGTRITDSEITINGTPVQMQVSQIGGLDTPTYVSSNGEFSECTQYAGGTLVSLNDTPYSGVECTIYAPNTTVGGSNPSGRFVLSQVNSQSGKTSAVWSSEKVYVSGNTINAYSFNASSDKRLKKNIKEYKSKGSILNVPIKEFDYKDTGEHCVGFIAQDLQKEFPDMVVENEDGYLSIKESKLIYLLLDEVKKLKEEVEELKGE